MNNIIKLIEDSGLNEERQLLLKNQFNDYIEVATEWNNKAKEIVVTDSAQVELMKLAKQGRLILREKRNDIERIRKEIKEQPLRECQAIDSVAKALKELITPTEEYLKEQEEFAKREEEARLNKLISERKEALEQYEVDTQYLDLGGMPQPMFEMLLKSSKFDYEQKILAREQEEKKRLAEIEAENKRIAEQKAEFERLRKLAEEQELKLKEEREKAYQEKQALLKEQLEKEIKVREEYEAKQREFEAKQKAELENARIKAEEERILAEDKAKREKIEGFFNKHKKEIFTRFQEESVGQESALFYMQRAYEIILEVTSK
jgi:hypothetical protein